MKPIDYSERVSYRPPPSFYGRMQWLGVLLTSLGLAPSDAVTLEVRGRKSGKTRRTPVIRLDHNGNQYLVALAGESNWARNVRAADGSAVIRRRGKIMVRLIELPVEDRSSIIDAYLKRRGRQGTRAGDNESRYYFGLTSTPTLEDIAEIAAYYPVFRIEPIA